MSTSAGPGPKILPHESMQQMERDLWVYCTSKPDNFLAYFRRAYAESPDGGVWRPPGLVLSWHWPAFFFSLIWLLYRKQYLLGLGFYAVNAGINVLIPGSPWPEWVLWLATKVVVALNARSIYVEKAVSKIRKARAQQIPVREWEAHLQLVGGVSYFSAVLAVGLWMVLAAYAISVNYG